MKLLPQIKLTKEQKAQIFLFAVATGILLRFIVMSVGHNYDFQSYLIVGDLMRSGKNVYASTERYNYGPIFFYIQGIFFEISTHCLEPAVTYRILIVSLLTMGDVGIAAWLQKYYGRKAALIFFLNPVSIIITGYHNQFDNMAILLMLWAIHFYHPAKKLNWNDLWFVLLFTASLTMKHILFIFPAWLLVSKGLPMVKKALYAFVPPILFLLSFVPYALESRESLQGILDHVFLYRSTNNAPLFRWLYTLVHLPSAAYTLIFMLLVCVMGWVFREKSIQYRTLMYLICLVAFASAVSNQYLAIPMAAVCLFGGKLKYVYMILMGHYLIWNSSGMEISMVYPYRLPNSEFLGYFIGCLLLAVIVIKEVVLLKKQKNSKIKVENMAE